MLSPKTALRRGITKAATKGPPSRRETSAKKKGIVTVDNMDGETAEGVDLNAVQEVRVKYDSVALTP